jgi:hypothetical protein
MAELRHGKVGRERGLLALFADDADAWKQYGASVSPQSTNDM